MLSTPFLTDLDSRAAVKGSRDPLGIQSIWTRLGRHVVGNLTTVTNSVRDFTTTLLGYYFAERVADDVGPGTELATFLMFEQLAAYSRGLANEDWRFRGTERARKNCSEGLRLTISADRAHQILSNQKMYGLWGLFTVPSRASGLLDGDPPRLTPPARELVEREYLPILDDVSPRVQRRLMDILRGRATTIDVKKADADLIDAIGRLLKRKLRSRERDFYRTYLLRGGPTDTTDGRQAQMAELLADTLSEPGFFWSPRIIGQLATRARKRGDDWAGLAYRLDRIRIAETVLGPASVLFSHLLGFDAKTVSSVTRRLKEQWGGEGLSTIDPAAFATIGAELGDGDDTTRDRWIRVAETLASGQYDKLIQTLVEQNQSVMAIRGGQPWLEREEGRLRVRFRDERGLLPVRSAVKDLWVFPYFLDSLRAIASELTTA